MGRVGKYQTRSDKKVDLKATITQTSKYYLYDFADICREPAKDVAEKLILSATDSPVIINSLSRFLRRDYRYNLSVAIGHKENPKLVVRNYGQADKVSIKFKRDNYECLCAIAYALDVTPSTAAAALIVLTMENREFMNDYISSYLNHLEARQIAAIHRLLKFKN